MNIIGLKTDIFFYINFVDKERGRLLQQTCMEPVQTVTQEPLPALLWLLAF